MKLEAYAKNHATALYEVSHKFDQQEPLMSFMEDFAKVINELGGRLLYIKSGSTGHTFKGVFPPPNVNNKPNYAVKVVAYPKKEKYGDMFNPIRPENTELLIVTPPVDI